MATYRPKSLNEINNSYDKSIASQNTIKDSENAISTATKQDMVLPSDADDVTAASESTVSDLTEDIQKFIRNFGNPVKEETRPVPRTTQIKPAAVTPKPSQKPAPQQTPAPAPKSEEKKAEKVEFVMTAEKSELFEEYMKIMSDEDDDSYFSRSKSKKKKKAKKAEDVAPVAEVQEPDTKQADEISEAMQTEASEDFTAPEYASDFEEPAAEKEMEDIYSYDEDFDEAPVKEKKKNVLLQLILIFTLLITLIGALGATVLNVVLKVNSGEAFADKYYIYTVSKNDAILNLTEGDLVLAIEETPEENDIVAYYNNTSKAFDFAVKRSTVGNSVTLAENESSNGQINIFNTNIHGKLIKIYPVVGSVAAAVCENYVILLAGLMALALLLILILAFAFGRNSKKNKVTEDGLTFDEEDDESVAELEIG